MGQLVTPTVYHIGYTTINEEGLYRYLEESGNKDFIKTIQTAIAGGVSVGEVLTSFMGKVCYASLTLDKNKNITRIRDIPENLIACWKQGHGSVWEHAQLNFIVRNCSRVFTHELVRHRVGTAFSQTSGRYVRGDSVDIVFDPILNPVKEDILEYQELVEKIYNKCVKKMSLDEMTDFDLKKKVTSALRRILPNGQSNEIGFSVNLRSLRHIVQMRTSRSAEWEIKSIFAQVYNLIKPKFPYVFYGSTETIVDGMLEISGMRCQPYEKD